jgi:cell wall-associated NlpC family hydrolase
MLLPPGTEALSKVGMPIKLKELEPGDLVFYNTRNKPYSHVGIYLGDGRFLHAPRPGASVRVESVQTPYWRARFNGARRLDPPTF